jgi:hypothetical protein
MEVAQLYEPESIEVEWQTFDSHSKTTNFQPGWFDEIGVCANAWRSEQQQNRKYAMGGR